MFCTKCSAKFDWEEYGIGNDYCWDCWVGLYDTDRWVPPFDRATAARDDILPMLRQLRAFVDSVVEARRAEWDASIAVLESIVGAQ
jgi:hypothetical protein